MPDVEIYLVGGPTGAGKTVLSRAIASAKRGLTLHLDNYFVDEPNVRTSTSTLYGRGPQWDHPLSVDLELATQNLTDLLDRGFARVPKFSFANNKRLGYGVHKLLSKKSVIVEGIHALTLQRRLTESSRTVYSIFVDARIDVRRKRISDRDSHHRNRPLSDFERRFYFIRIAEKRWILAQRRLASLVLDTSSGTFQVIENRKRVANRPV